MSQPLFTEIQAGLSVDIFPESILRLVLNDMIFQEMLPDAILALERQATESSDATVHL